MHLIPQSLKLLGGSALIVAVTAAQADTLLSWNSSIDSGLTSGTPINGTGVIGSVFSRGGGAISKGFNSGNAIFSVAKINSASIM